MLSRSTLWVNARLATLDPAHGVPYGRLDHHVLIVRDGKIAGVVPEDSVRPDDFDVVDARGCWITPGLIDCHTHLVYGGSRAAEWEQRLLGVPYEEIAAQGGGILSSVRATRALSESELYTVSMPRVQALMREGVTTVEMKTGYGLSLEHELKQLRVARSIGASCPVEISSTLLAAHALPPEFTGDADGYIDHVISVILPEACQYGLIEAVDVFCESIGFSLEQTKCLFTAARSYGIPVKGHVAQLSAMQGAHLVADFGGLSADHVEYLDDEGIRRLKIAGTVAVLLPGAFYFLRETRKPPVEKLRAAGVPMAVSTDLNPGTSPFASLRLAMNQACVLFGLTPEEALTGVTRHAAQALDRGQTHGRLAAGYMADFLLWEIDHPAELAYSVGVNPLRTRVYRGMPRGVEG